MRIGPNVSLSNGTFIAMNKNDGGIQFVHNGETYYVFAPT